MDCADPMERTFLDREPIVHDTSWPTQEASFNPLPRPWGAMPMDISNKTRKPLSLPLPGGKRLFLGPGQTGQVTAKALEHPPVAELLKAGAIEATEGRSRGAAATGDKARMPFGFRHGGPGAMRQSGDR